MERPLRTILTSPLARCHRTAEILRDACALPVPPESLPALAPGGSWREVLLRLGEESPEASIALVGHEPDIGKFAGVLLFGAPASLPLKKAGACSIEFEGPVTPGGGQLRWFLPPRALASIAGARSKV